MNASGHLFEKRKEFLLVQKFLLQQQSNIFIRIVRFFFFVQIVSGCKLESAVMVVKSELCRKLSVTLTMLMNVQLKLYIREGNL